MDSVEILFNITQPAFNNGKNLRLTIEITEKYMKYVVS